MLYLVTLSLALGYFSSTKFNSKFVFYMFEGILIIRPILILLYTLCMGFLEFKRRGTKLHKREFGAPKGPAEMQPEIHGAGRKSKYYDDVSES